jgi:glycosyltransferase involved in cell wall biosynthesis
MAQKNPCIKLIQQKNSGPGPARNTGMDAACGKYIYFVDADDVLMPNSMAVNLDFMDCHNLEALHVEFKIVKSDAELLFQPKHEIANCSDVCTGIQYLKDTNLLTCDRHAVELWQVIFRLDVIRNNNLRSIYGRAQDTMLHIELMTNVQRMAWSNVCTYVYVEYPNSICHMRWDYKRCVSKTMPLLERLCDIRKKYKDLYADNGLLMYLDVYRSGMCYINILWPMVRECASPGECRKYISELRKLEAYPIDKPSYVPGYNFRYNKIMHGLWKLSRHYYLWMALITVNHLLRKAPAVEADRVGR